MLHRIVACSTHNETTYHSSKTYIRDQHYSFGEDDAIRPWLKGFVNDVGRDAATELLAGVGDVHLSSGLVV